ncbi:MAG: universal stress protein [Dehalococcoidia bacterium]|nr:universal stress protein [Dehalococcoidia bacterium]
MFKKILLCLDGSSLAEQMIPYATSIAQSYSSSLVLVQVVNVPSALAAASAQGAESVVEDEMRRLAFTSQTYLDQLAERLREQGIATEAVTIQGSPGNTIVEYATANEIDLIAIATHGRKNIGRLVFGSVADHVIRHTCIPVITVNPKETKT